MTVAELIEALRTRPSNEKVCVSHPDEKIVLYETDSVGVEQMAWSEHFDETVTVIKLK